jgi:hypothetical protein
VKWSKLKQRIEDGFAASVQGRVEVWNTRYRGAHDHAGEAWITIDKEPVHSSAELSKLKQLCLNSLGKPEPDTGPELSLEAFNKALFDYLNLSVEDAASSENSIIRALSILDKRLGKRRLAAMDVGKDSDLVRRLYVFRCQAEGVRPSSERQS